MNDHIRSCLIKRPYASEGEASKVLKTIKKQGKLRNFTSFNIYKCDFCPHWHLGHRRRIDRSA